MRTCTIVLVLVSAAAWAAPQPPPTDETATPAGEPVPSDGQVETPPDSLPPPPDPSRGERADGRTYSSTGRDAALFLPRLVLLPPRILLAGLAYPIRYSLDLDQKHHIYTHIVEALTSDDGQIGIRPVFVYSTGFVPGIGLHFFDTRLLGPRTGFDAEFQFGGPNIIYADVTLRPTQIGDRVETVFSTTYTRRDDFVFAGINNTAPPPPGGLGISRYAADEVDVRANMLLHMTPWLAGALSGAFGFRRFGNGTSSSNYPPIGQVYCVRRPDGSCLDDVVDPRLVPGFDTGTQFLRLGAVLHADTRVHPYSAASGFTLDLRGDYSHGLGFDDSSYFRFGGAANVYINLWQRARVLVLRAAAEDVAPLGTYPVPFTELAILGGRDDLRGFIIDRFHGFSSFYATAEYRWPIWMWIDGTAFVDYGGVFDRYWKGFGAGQMQPDAGLGVRIHTTDRFYLRAQVAYGWGEGWNAVFAVTDRP